ncbi:MAG: GLPGLI family protein, partial [Bacteroidaceae bacterium]|nr:GLPGLI family protein [Bacteroidaceae bacterium]
DSVLTADYKAGASQETITQHAQAYGYSSVSYQIFKNHPMGKVTTIDRLATTNILCEEDNECPEWQLHSDTMTILSYPCQKATCRFRGRDYTAWYTMEVPVSDGPWKLYGLPGLILKAEDSRGHFSFTCTGLEQSRDAKPILIHTKGREKLSRKELDKMYERFYSDPIGFMEATSPNVKINITDGQGNPIKKFSEPYNPIEINK